MSTPTATTPLVVYQFHVLLLRVSPAIWRRLLVPNNTSIAELHFTLQIIMGWHDRRINRFLLHGQRYGVTNPDRPPFVTDHNLPIAAWRLRPQQRLLYLYDLLANWRLQLRLEQVLSFDHTVGYPYCLAGARQGPPEFCAGPADFMSLRDQHTRGYVERRLVELGAVYQGQESDPDIYRLQLRRLEYWRQADHFDRQAANSRLQQYASGNLVEL